MSSTDNWGGIPEEAAWSEWTWNDEYNCDYRYRCNAVGEWEYEYRAVNRNDSTPRNSEDTLNAYHLGPIPETAQPEYSISQTFSSSPNYLYDDSVSALMQQLAGTSIDYSLDPQVGGKGTDSCNDVPNYPSQNTASQPRNNFPRKIFTRNPKSEVDLDPSFKQHRSKDFKFGRIFKVLWSEPTGSGGTEITERAQMKGKYGERAYESIRRFLIVDDSRKGHSICLPIMTYGGQGTTKFGVHPEDHALIYTSKKEPALLKHESLEKKAIRVDAISPSHTFDPTSRLNYAKLYTVEHNVKVVFIGQISKSYERQVVVDYNNTHRPLPDRFNTQNIDEDFSHTQGPDPDYDEPLLFGNYRNPPGDQKPNRNALNRAYQHPSIEDNLYDAEEADGSHYRHHISNLYDAEEPPNSSDGSNSERETLGLRENDRELPSITSEKSPAPSPTSLPEAGSQSIERPTIDHSRPGSRSFPAKASMGDSGYQSFYHESGSQNIKKPSIDQLLTSSGSLLAQPSISDSGYQSFYGMGQSVEKSKLATRGRHWNSELSSSTQIGLSSSRRWNLPLTSMISSGHESLDIGDYNQLKSGDEPRPQIGEDIEDTSGVEETESDQGRILEKDETRIRSKEEERLLTPASEDLGGDTLVPNRTTSGLRAWEQLSAFLLDDLDVQSLIREAVKKSSLDTVEQNLRVCLEKFSVQLENETSLSVPSRISNIISRSSVNMAHTIIQILERKSSNLDRTTQIQGASKKELQDSPDPVEQFTNVATAIAASESLRLFKGNLGTKLNLDPFERVIFEVWPMEPGLEAIGLSHEVEWELMEFLDCNFPQHVLLGSVLTFTGYDDKAQAATCEQYLRQRWPESGPFLLGCMERFLIDREEGVEVIVDDENLNVHARITHIESRLKSSSVELFVRANYPSQVEIAEMVAWLGAALRHSPHDRICRSSVEVIAKDSTEKPMIQPEQPRFEATQPPDLKREQKHSQVETEAGISKKRPHFDSAEEQSEQAEQQQSAPKIIKYSLLGLEAVPPSGSCWHGLFPHAVLAYGFPIRERKGGYGLEISFADMMVASKCLSLVEYDQGLIAHGLTSILVPTAKLPEDDALEWHFVNLVQRPARELSRLFQVMKLPEFNTWHRELRPEDLVSRRCFLGLANVANVVIGTRDYQTELGLSGAPESPKVQRIQSQLFTNGPGFLGYSTSSGLLFKLPTSVQSNAYAPPDKDIYDLLYTARNHLVLLYDTKNERGWYLPQASLVLHMVHASISMREYQLYDKDSQVFREKCTAFSIADPDGYSKASYAIKSSLRLRIRKDYCQEKGPVEEPFGDFVRKFWITLSNIGANLASKEPEFRNAKTFAPDYIHGVEYVDAANMERPERMPIKEVRVNQAWSHLTTREPIVIFSKDIQPAIVPDTAKLCQTWATVPANRKYLVLMGSAARSLLKYQTAGLPGGLDWEFQAGESIIQSHETGSKVSVFHVQRLRAHDNPRPNEPLLDAIAASENCCLVFGNDSEEECREALGNSLQGAMSSSTTPNMDSSVGSLPSILNDSAIFDHSSGSNSSIDTTQTSLFGEPGALVASSKSLALESQGRTLFSPQSQRSGVGSKQQESRSPESEPAYTLSTTWETPTNFSRSTSKSEEYLNSNGHPESSDSRIPRGEIPGSFSEHLASRSKVTEKQKSRKREDDANMRRRGRP